MHLLDVNVLLSLAWPNHVHHTAARAWFAAREPVEWATTPITEVGFVRLSSNRAVVDEALTPLEAVRLLEEVTEIKGHIFIPDDVPGLIGRGIVDPSRIGGHRLVTDAHLLALASRHGASLVTFDRGLAAFTTEPNTLVLLAR